MAVNSDLGILYGMLQLIDDAVRSLLAAIGKIEVLEAGTRGKNF